MCRGHVQTGYHQLTTLTFLVLMGTSVLMVVTPAAAQDVTQITEVEGITEYSLDNGLRFLLFPLQAQANPSAPRFRARLRSLRPLSL